MNQDDPVYAGYHQISWLIPPPWDKGLMIMKQLVKNHKVCQAMLDFLGASKQQFQTLQCQVPEEVYFHDRSWQIKEVPAMPSEEVCAIFWELTELLWWYELLLLDHVLCAQLQSNLAVHTECEGLVVLVFGTSFLNVVIHDPLPELQVLIQLFHAQHTA